jgi:DNA-binding transcriptional LysR family regulator
MTANQHTARVGFIGLGDQAAPQGLELRHLRYFVAVADAGSFTHAAERIFIAQPTLSQQIRRLEQIVGAPLLHRRREGLRLTTAGGVLLDASRNVLSLVDREVSRTRQAAGLGRPRLRMVIPPGLPEDLAVKAAAALRAASADADMDVAWLETALDTEFSLIHTRRADAGLGWLTTSPDAVPAPLEVMILGEFEPDLWIPASHPAARRGSISLDELASMDVIFGPRRAEPGTYDAWTSIVRAIDPRFEFTDPPLRHSLPVMLAFAAIAGRPAAVLTGPATAAGGRATPIRRSQLADTSGMVKVSLRNHPLTASAALVWSGDLPRPLQQMLFQTADNLTTPPPPQRAELASPTAA